MRYLLLLWAVILLTGSLLPISAKAALHLTNNHLFLHPAAHIACFAALSFLLTGLAKSLPQRCVALFASLSFGCLLEVFEHVLYRQPLELSDMRLDAVGSAIGLILGVYVIRVYPCPSVADTRELLARFLHSNPIFQVTAAWEPLLAVASSEYILPALYPHFLSSNLLTFLPPDISSSLQTISHLNRERNQSILSQSHSIVGALNAVGIEPIALKGLAYLHSGIFPDPAMRYLLDLDFLIPETQLAAAARALTQIGYTPYLGDALAQFRHHAPQMHHPNSIPVELHHSIGLGLSSRILPASDIVSCSTSLHSNNTTLRLPSPDHLLTHLVLHSQVRHTYRDRIFPPLRAMYDLLLLTRHFALQLDWPSIQNRFRAHGRQTTLLLHLLHVHETLGMPLPFPIRLSLIANFRWSRRRLLNRHPALRFLDPFYLFMSAFSRRFSLLRAIFAVPGGWKEVLKVFATPGFYRRLLSDL